MNDAWFKHFTNHLIANPHSRTRSRSAIIRIKSTNLHIHYTEYGFNLPPEIRIVEILSLLKLEKSSLLIICYQMKLAISSNLEKQVALNSAEPTKMKMYNVIIYLDFLWRKISNMFARREESSKHLFVVIFFQKKQRGEKEFVPFPHIEKLCHWSFDSSRHISQWSRKGFRVITLRECCGGTNSESSVQCCPACLLCTSVHFTLHSQHI